MKKEVQEALALTLQPNAYRRYSELCAAQEVARKGMSDDEKRELYLAAQGGNAKAQSELCGAVITQVNINILGQLFAMSFFDEKPYGPADWPIIKAEIYDKNFFVTSIGLNGGPPAKQMAEGIYDYPLMFGFHATQPYEFPIFNAQTGPLNFLSKAIARTTYEMGLHLDNVALTLLKSNKLASGLRGLLSLHSSIVAANIPDANYLDLSGLAGTAGTWTIEKIKRILDYTVRWTQDVQPLEGGDLAGAMTVKAVHCSSTRLRDMWDMVDMVALVGSQPTGEPNFVTGPSQTIPEDIRQEVFRSGKLESMFGHPFTLVPNNRLAADEVYVAMSRPCGTFHSKPTYDQAFHDQSPEMTARNMERYWARKLGVFHQTNSQIPNYLVVKL